MRIALILAVGLSVFSQTVEVHDLTPTESAEGRKLYQQMVDAKAAYDEFTYRMSAKYIDQKNCNSFSVAINVIPSQRFQ